MKMNLKDLQNKIERLEFHQTLLIQMIQPSGMDLYKIIIREGLTEEDYRNFCSLCEDTNNKLIEQKAEGFVTFSPLFKEFKHKLQNQLQIVEVINACVQQHFYADLMLELKKYL